MNCYVGRVIASVWVVPLVEHNFFNFSYTVVEQAPLRLEVVI